MLTFSFVRRMAQTQLSPALIIFATSAGAARADDDGAAVLLVYGIIFAIGFALYLIPTWIALARSHPNRWLIAVVNITLGGTGLGWLGSLVWAMSAVHRSPTGNHGGESGLNIFVNDVKPVSLPPAQVSALIPVQSPTIDDLSERLLKLKQLRDSGVVSEEEYNAMRQPLVEAVQSGLR